MGANPHANGGLLLRDLPLPDLCDLRRRGAATGRGRRGIDARVQGQFIRDVCG